MDKLKMQSMDKVQGNIEKIRALFPNAVTEVKRGNEIKLAVDFDVLKQELTDTLIDDRELRYQFTWPDKQKSVLLANTPVYKTLRPVRDDETTPTGEDSNGNPYCSTGSVDYDTTQNLYIEGDNLDVLKLLQETYLGKVKMIYIDPPYNTGNDFVYNDDFTIESGVWSVESGDFDENGNRLVQNTESNGRFHTDWLNMIYPRLRLAKDLLSDDGTIFISIDDNEQASLKKVCDEIFDISNYVTSIPRLTSPQRSGQEDYMNVSHDYLLVYSFAKTFKYAISRDIDMCKVKHDKNGMYIEGDTKAILAAQSQGYSKGGDYDFEYNGRVYSPIDKNGKRNRWLWTKQRMQAAADLGILVETKHTLRMQVYLDKKFEEGTNKLVDKEEGLIFHTADFMTDNAYSNPNGVKDIGNLGIKDCFTNPKPVALLKTLIKMATEQDSYILDFFSGSATTAHAVMQLNAEDGGNRKFIMVQLPEPCDEKSEAYKAGYKNICEIGKERIRRAGKKILQECGVRSVESEAKGNNSTLHSQNSKLDIGFRVLKLDSSNMQPVYYNPEEYTQTLLDGLTDNIKADRTPLDLLFQVMLDLGKPLSAKIEEKVLECRIRSVESEAKDNNSTLHSQHYTLYVVDGNDLIACFDSNITEEVVKTIAQLKPLYAVFRDSSLASDSVAANLDQIFATYSPTTVRKVL